MIKYILPIIVLTIASCQEFADKQAEVKEVTTAVSELDSLANIYLSESDREKLKKSISIDSILKYKNEIGEVANFIKDNNGLIDSIKNKAIGYEGKDINYDDIQDVLNKNKGNITILLDSLKKEMQK